MFILNRSNDVAYNTLASLSDEDLKMLNISDRALREKMLEEFKGLPNQTEHIEGYFPYTYIMIYFKLLFYYFIKH